MKDRRLTSPVSSKVRPTTDKIRSSVFSILADHIKEASVLDAFAGTGAFGIESYSRGAESATFIDMDVDCLKINLKLLPKGFSHIIKRGDFLKVLWRAGEQFHIIFIDPPYGIYKTDVVLDIVTKNNLLKSGGIIIYEEFCKTPFDSGENFIVADERKYGDTTIRFLEMKI